MIGRLPIRVRLTLAFALTMAIVLGALAAFLYLRLESELDRQLDQGLRARADDVALLVRRSTSGLAEEGGRLTETGESLGQVIDEQGRVVDGTPGLRDRIVLTPDQLAQARERPILIESAAPILGEPARLLARPIEAHGERLVVVVGAALDDRNDALAGLRRQLLIGGPIALALASLAGYLLAAAALRPVEAMRRQAAEISATSAGRRLPVPEAGDEISRLGETLNEMLARLETALARERRFVTDASHELRTPLALMKTEIELALRRERSPAELEQALRSAAEETDRLSQLAEDLLVIARSDQGELPLRRTSLRAQHVLETVAARFRPRAVQAGRDILVDCPPELELEGDPLRIEQALGNLVENALRYGAGTVTLQALSAGERVELHVTDCGSGFPDDFLQRAFERFSRADEARARGGSGLGLAIVAVIADAHGGEAHAANLEGGTDVWLELPAT